ncbi:hypothetical protein PP304_gp024 [Gordonia phage Phendrix]|uniref:Uncharacterized protein n=2 Tax=Godonkavirus TaxID=2733178 RepID=A0A4D6E1V5_9CAUD|nr:hypothetical protein HOV33_gp024 [Gordonia phage GodonK]YP_010649068.1 hypothetical protein PP304_gp024 [Gordonia phage Phendrix]QBZ72643.1 hypothetical protein SEA_GODONK_24 [Gordonia phage GodonK]QDK02572.1 hypothetical protein SEA_PHENDRIX_24 [Gordonia phage Phendrix]
MIETTERKVDAMHKITVETVWDYHYKVYEHRGSCSCGTSRRYLRSESLDKWIQRHRWLTLNSHRAMPIGLL